MKTVKIALIALITVFTFGSANAQVRIKASIGARPQHRTVVVRRPYHRRVVLIHRPYHRRPVIVHRGPVFRRHH